MTRSVALVFLLMAFAVFGSSTASGQGRQVSANQVPAGLARPGNVPEGYVVTPFGYFQATCVQRLARGEHLLPNHRVQHANGTVAASAKVCGYPRYTRKGAPVSVANSLAAAPSELPQVNGWLENANLWTGSASQSYGAVVARWTVPPNPKFDDGQVLYYFPGLEDIQNTLSILQPVLQYWNGQWTIASWNCCLDGVVTVSPSVNVSPGDRLYGSVTSTCPAGTLACPTWNVLSLDLSTGESTTLGDTPSEGQIFNWAFGGVLEPYFVGRCGDYPSDKKTTFDHVDLFDQNMQSIAKPEWSTAFNSTETPQCGYGVDVGWKKVTLSY